MAETIRYWMEFVTVPLGIIVLAYLSPPTSIAAVSSYVVGYLLWILIEYWMHRYVLHVIFRMEHVIHHKEPLNEHGSPPTLLSQALLILFCMSSITTFGTLVGPALSAGLLIGYLSYIVVHHLIHIGLFADAGFAKRHELHHRGWQLNFNVLCPLGDLLFGTYSMPSK